MPKLNVSQSISIHKDIQTVFETVANFNHWKIWSPWLIQDPKATVNIVDDAKYYSWEGKVVGAGNMRIVKEEKDKFLEMDLFFLKPWKSKAKVNFTFVAEGTHTKVTWSMDSKLPFFLFFLKKMMVTLIEMDYKKGLMMLKEYVETGEISSKLEDKGVKNYEGCQYIGIRTTCNMDQLGDAMGLDFQKLTTTLSQENIASAPLTIYEKWQFAQKRVTYISAIPVKSIPSDLSNEFVKGEIPALSTYIMAHYGSYNYLGNAWGAMYSMQRAKFFKMNKKVKPFEIYQNDPKNVPENELLTEIHFAVK